MRREEHTSGEIIKTLFDRLNLKEKYFLYRLSYIWESLMGKEIQQYTERIQVKNKELYFKILSAAARQELSMNRHLILKTIHKELGEEIFTDIHFI